MINIKILYKSYYLSINACIHLILHVWLHYIFRLLFIIGSSFCLDMNPNFLDMTLIRKKIRILFFYLFSVRLWYLTDMVILNVQCYLH